MTKRPKTIGVLALQGSVKDTQDLDGLIIPGGESTTLMKLLKSTSLDSWIKEASPP